MTQAYEIPTSPTPQSFTITLSGVQYQLALRWCDPAASWLLDIADVNGVPLLSGIAVVTGTDLLDPYAYLGFGGALYAATDHDPDTPPGFDTLGRTSHIYWITK